MNQARDIEEIVIAAHVLTRVAAMTTHNDTPAAQWRALSVLASDGPMRLGTLATMARTTQPGMTKLVGQLHVAGLVDRLPDPTDSRATVVAITDAGADALSRWREELRDALAPMFADLSEEEWDALSTTARILSSRAGQLAGANR